MTAPKATRRRRRTTTSGIPKNIKEWFAGERKFTYYAYTFPYRAHLGEYWRIWKKENPTAVMPTGLKNLIDTPAYPPGVDLENQG